MTSPHLASLVLLATSSPPVDAVRQSLSAHSERMFLLLVISSIVTGVGVILEAPGEVHELARWWKLKRLKKVIGWRVPITFFGLLLVIGGIVGEGIFEFLSADAETAIRAHDEQVLGDTIVQAGTAKDAADAAVMSSILASRASSEAVGKANEANEASRDAVSLAAGARREADSYARDIASAKEGASDAISKLASAEQRLADSTQREAAAEARLSAIKTPRNLVRTKELVDTLSAFKGTEFTLNVFLDDESNNFSVIVAKTLKAAGWIRKQPTTMNLGNPTVSTVFAEGEKAEFVPSCLNTGIGIHITERETLAELQARPLTSLSTTLRAGLALSNAIGPSIFPPDENNVSKGILDREPASEHLMLCIGKKP